MSIKGGRTIYPAMVGIVNSSEEWLSIRHKTEGRKGWISKKEAPFYIEFTVGSGNNPKVKYEKWIFKKDSFIEDLDLIFLLTSR